MNDIQRNRLEKLLEEGYHFRFGDYISEGFRLFQKNAGSFIGFALVAGLIVTIANFIPIIGPLVNNLVLTPALTVGFYLVAHEINKGELTEFRDFFKGFDYVSQLALAAFIIGLIIVVSLLPLFIAAGMSGFIEWIAEAQENPFGVGEPPAFPWWSVIFAVPAIYLGIAYGWTNMFIAFYGMSFWEAMEMSRKLISKQWFLLFFFFIVIGLIAGSGALFLLVGIVVTFPIMLCAQYVAFADVTRLMEEEETDIVDHLVG